MAISQLEMNMHPLAAKRDQQAIQTRLQSLMKREGLDALVLTKRENILYASGYYCKFAYGPGVAPGMAALLVVPAEGTPQLFVNMMEYDDARRQTVGIEVSPLPSFVFVDDGTPESHKEKGGNIDPLAGFEAALRCAMDAAPNATIGIQKGTLPAAMLSVLDCEVKMYIFRPFETSLAFC